MPPVKVELPDAERYIILSELDLENKAASGYVEKKVIDRPGPVMYSTLESGTIAQIVRYVIRHNGWQLVKAHQYKTPSGNIVGPDPLYICINDVVFVREERH